MKLFEMYSEMKSGNSVLGRQKPLQKDLIVYPNATFDRSQAVKLPAGTAVEMAIGGDNYQGGTAKIVASVNGESNTWFTWNEKYYEALSSRKVSEAEESTALTGDQVAEAWKAEFPNSSVHASKAFGGGVAFKFRLAKDNTEVSSGIMENDPLNYSALLDENGNWKEWATSMHIAPPEDSYLAFGTAKFRKKSAKNVTLPQIQKRFKQVKEFVSLNADKLHQVSFDIGQKLGGVTEGLGEDGIGKAIKKGVKSVKRSFTGWDGMTAHGQPHDSSEPYNMVNRHAEMSTDELKRLQNKPGRRLTKHSPGDLQQKLIKRNLRKRGERDFEKYMVDEANNSEQSEEVTQVLMRLQAAGGTVYKKAYLQKGDETAILAQNGHIRFAIFQDGKVKRAKKFIEFQRDGWELEMNLGEDIVPYTEKAGNSKSGAENGEHYDDVTGEIFSADQVEQDEDGKMIEKPYRSDPEDESLEQWKDNYNKGYEDEPESVELTPGQKAQAQGMFADIAAGGGDPIEHLMVNHEMDMDAINALAKENGYDDAYEWAESYSQSESIISNAKRLIQR